MSKAPALPYNSSSGWSGSSTSRNRAKYLDTSGITAQNQLAIIKELKKRKSKGLIVHELRDVIGTHHGGRSGPLSNLHKAGYIARLKETRGRCHVYVLPQYINNRPIDPPKRTVNKKTHVDTLTKIHKHLENKDIKRALNLINKELAEWNPKKKKN